MKRLSWKYLAGLIDGEGCIDMQTANLKLNGEKRFYCRPRLRMTLSGKAGEMILPQLQANFGGHFDPCRKWIDNPNWLPPHSWALTGKAHLRSVLQNLVNHLIIKKEQARFAIAWMDIMDSIPNGNQVGKNVPEEVRRFAHEELKAMKRDPQRLSEGAVLKIRELMRQSDQA